jgi:flagellar biosynthesis protein FlhF
MDDGDSSSNSSKMVFICKDRPEALFKIRHQFGDNCKVEFEEVKKRGKGFWGFLPWNRVKCVKATATQVSHERNIKPKKLNLKDLNININSKGTSENSKADSILEAIYNISPTLSEKKISIQPNNEMPSFGQNSITNETTLESRAGKINPVNELGKGKNLDIFLGKLKQDQHREKSSGNGMTVNRTDEKPVDRANDFDRLIRGNTSVSDNVLNQNQDILKKDKTENKDKKINNESAGAGSDMAVQSDVLKELNEMKDILRNLLKEKSPVMEKSSPVMENMLDHLYKNGMQRAHIQVMKDVMEKNLHRYQKTDRDFIKEYIFNGLLKLVNVSDPLLPDERSMKCVALIGPTGVGKTTTLAKLATIFWHTYQCKVAFLTIDTFRIGASDQLSKFGSIIGIPTKVAFDPDEAENCIREYRETGYDLVLIDCFGFSPCDNNKMTDLCEFFNRLPDTQKILTLSANMKYEDLLEAVNRFKFAGCSDLIITHMDSTKTYGPLISLLGETRYPLMYTTHGQNVPGDIQEANLRHIVGRVIYNEGFQFAGSASVETMSTPVSNTAPIKELANYNNLRSSSENPINPLNKEKIRVNNNGIPEFLVSHTSESGAAAKKKAVSPVVFTDLLEKVGSSLDNSEELSKLSMDPD